MKGALLVNLGSPNSTSVKDVKNYLDEFCYKYNRRYFGEKVFDRALIAAVSNHWY